MAPEPSALSEPAQPLVLAQTSLHQTRPPAPPAQPLQALPAQPSLEQLKNQAKTLLAAARHGDPAAQERLGRAFPATRQTSRTAPGTAPASASSTAPGTAPPSATHPTLAQAQLVIAREHGFLSWARLRRAVELAPLRAQLERFTERGWPVRHAAQQALAAAGADGMSVVLEGLSHPHPRVRRGATGFLDHFATDACVLQLTELALHDPDAEVRRTALHTLLCEDCKETPLQGDMLPLLVHAFRQDVNRRVRFTVALALRRYAGRPDVQEAFRAAVREDPSALVRRTAVSGLRGEDVPDLLLPVAHQDPDAHVRVAAAVRLSTAPQHTADACRALEAALQEDAKPQVQRDAHLALKRLSPVYRQRVAQQARDANLARVAQRAAQPAGAELPGADAGATIPAGRETGDQRLAAEEAHAAGQPGSTDEAPPAGPRRRRRRRRRGGNGDGHAGRLRAGAGGP